MADGIREAMRNWRSLDDRAYGEFLEAPVARSSSSSMSVAEGEAVA